MESKMLSQQQKQKLQMEEVILTPLLAPPNPQSIKALRPRAQQLVDQILREYTANGGTLPFRPYDIYGWYGRDPPSRDQGDNQVNESDISQISMLESSSGTKYDNNWLQPSTSQQNLHINEHFNCAVSNAITEETPMFDNIFHKKNPVRLYSTPRRYKNVESRNSDNMNKNKCYDNDTMEDSLSRPKYNNNWLQPNTSQQNLQYNKHFNSAVSTSIIEETPKFENRFQKKNPARLYSRNSESLESRNSINTNKDKYQFSESMSNDIIEGTPYNDANLNSVALHSKDEETKLNINSKIVKKSNFISKNTKDNFFDSNQAGPSNVNCENSDEPHDVVKYGINNRNTYRNEQHITNIFPPDFSEDEQNCMASEHNSINFFKETTMRYVSYDEIPNNKQNPVSISASQSSIIVRTKTVDFSECNEAAMNQNKQSKVTILQHAKVSSNINSEKLFELKNDWLVADDFFANFNSKKSNEGAKFTHINDENYRNVETNCKIFEEKELKENKLYENVDLLNNDNNAKISSDKLYDFEENQNKIVETNHTNYEIENYNNYQRISDRHENDIFVEEHIHSRYRCDQNINNIHLTSTNKACSIQENNNIDTMENSFEIFRKTCEENKKQYNSQNMFTQSTENNIVSHKSNYESRMGAQTLEECGFLLKNITPIYSKEKPLFSCIQNNIGYQQHCRESELEDPKPSTSKDSKDCEELNSEIEILDYNAKNENRKSIMINPQKYLEELSDYVNDWAVSETFFSHIFGCTPTEASQKNSKTITNNIIESEDAQNVEDNLTYDSVYNNKFNDYDTEKNVDYSINTFGKCTSQNAIASSSNANENIELYETYSEQQQTKSRQIEFGKTFTKLLPTNERTLSETFERKLSFEESYTKDKCNERKNDLSERFKRNLSFEISKDDTIHDKNDGINKSNEQQSKQNQSTLKCVTKCKKYKMEVSDEKVVPKKYVQSKLTDVFDEIPNKIKRISKKNEEPAKKIVNTKIDDFFKQKAKPCNNKIRKAILDTNKKILKQSTIKISTETTPTLEFENYLETYNQNIDENIVKTSIKPENVCRNITKTHPENKIISKAWNISTTDKRSPDSKRKPNADIFIIKRKKTKFCTPYKSQFEELDTSYEVFLLNEKNRADLENKIRTNFPVEINFDIVFKEGFCQLSRPSTTKSLSTPVGVMIGILWKPGSFSWYYLETLDTDEDFNTDTYRNFIYALLNSNPRIRRNGYDVKTLYQHLLRTFSIPDGKVSMTWDLWDPLIGCWILNPDKPPASFGGALAILDLSNNCKVTSSESITNACYMITVLSEAVEKMRLTLLANGLFHVFAEIETKIISILAVMEMHGVRADQNKLSAMGFQLNEKLHEYETRAHAAAGKSFKINSTVQVRHILYDELKLDTMTNAHIKETAILKSKSTSEATLLLLRSLHPLPNLILEYRHIHKAKSTYVDAILKSLNNNLIKTTWDQIGAATGRLSSKNPNLQAIPKQSFSLTSFIETNDAQEETLQLRAAFVARHNYTLLAIDFQHIEFRVFAHLAQDANLLAAFRTSGDIFINLSNIWLGDNISNSKADQRNRTKRIVYAVMYGAGNKKLSEILNIDQIEARKIISSFTTKFPGLREFGATVIKKCQKVGFLTSLSGRRRYFPNIKSPIYGFRAQSERQAVNFVIQGSAADICKSAMIYTERLLRGNSALKCSLLLQIHDELVWEIADECLSVTKDLIVNAMCNTAEICKKFGVLSVPLPVCVTTGKNWGEMTAT